MLKTVLLILTLGPGGTPHMALTDASSAQDCADKADVVGQILTAAGADIVALRCGTTDLDLAPYEHGLSAEQMRWRYRVRIHGTSLQDGFSALPVDAAPCSADPGAQVY